MPFRLKNLAISDITKLTDRTVYRANEISIGDWPGIRAQGARKKVIECVVSSNVRFSSFSHIHAIASYEPADDSRCQAACFRIGKFASKYCDRLFRQTILNHHCKT